MNYSGGILDWVARKGFLDFTVMGGPMRRATEQYLERERLPVDEHGRRGPYDLVVTASDLLVQRNVRAHGTPMVLVQEGMTDPETATYKVVRQLGLPRWMASTAAWRSWSSLRNFASFVNVAASWPRTDVIASMAARRTTRSGKSPPTS